MKYIVAFYEVDRAPGGPEEGGWWYDTGSLERIHRACATKARAHDIAARANRLIERLQRNKRPVSSVAYDGGRHAAFVFPHACPAEFPETRPTYS